MPRPCRFRSIAWRFAEKLARQSPLISALPGLPQTADRRITFNRRADASVLQASLYASRIVGPLQSVDHWIQAGIHQLFQMLTPLQIGFHSNLGVFSDLKNVRLA